MTAKKFLTVLAIISGLLGAMPVAAQAPQAAPTPQAVQAPQTAQTPQTVQVPQTAPPAKAIRTPPAPNRGPEERCGWFENPALKDIWFTDADGQWIIAVRGGYQMGDDWQWPDFSNEKFPAEQWMHTNVNFGYGCACLTGVFDPATREVINVTKATAKLLTECRDNKALKEPGGKKSSNENNE